MRIDSKSSIAGRPALDIRQLLRHTAGDPWPPEMVSDRLGTSMEEAERVIKALAKDGYIEPDQMYSERQYWKNTLKGNALSLASAGRPVRRSTAERKVREFLDRVRCVNEDDYFLCRVTKVVVFGSYLRNSQTLNDVDLGVELQPRYEDQDDQTNHEKERIREAYRKGRRFNNFTDEMFWPYQEVLVFLKSRSRTISLHTTGDPILQQVEYRTLFRAPDEQEDRPTIGCT